MLTCVSAIWCIRMPPPWTCAGACGSVCMSGTTQAHALPCHRTAAASVTVPSSFYPSPPRARWELDSHHQKLQFAQNNVKSHAGVSGQSRLPRRAAHMQISGLMSPACRTEDRGNEVREERVERGKRKRGNEQPNMTRVFFCNFFL